MSRTHVTESGNPFAHFTHAQTQAYARAVAELRDGRKVSHWMWFIFPQLKCLGRSATALRFGIANLEEAKAYAAHPILGARLRECVALANAHTDESARDVFGAPDDLKYRSCLTLFLAATGEPLFQQGIDGFYGGEGDPLTLAALQKEAT